MEKSDTYLWYYGLGEEPDRYYGGYETSEEAMKEAEDFRSEGPVVIAEACHGDLTADVFDFDRVSDSFSETNSDYSNEDGELGLEEATSKQRRELEQALAETFQVWLTRHKLGKAWGFKDIRQTFKLTQTGDDDEKKDISLPDQPEQGQP